MGVGVRAHLIDMHAQCDLLRARMLCTFFNFERVVVFLQHLDRRGTKAILSHFGARVATDCDIESGLVIHNASNGFANLLVEEGCHIGKQVLLDLRAPISILRASTVSMRVTILTHFDAGQAGPFGQRYAPHTGPVQIGPRAYIGACAAVLPSVSVGEGSLVAAGALVNRDVPPKTVVAGVPARIISTLE